MCQRASVSWPGTPPSSHCPCCRDRFPLLPLLRWEWWSLKYLAVRYEKSQTSWSTCIHTLSTVSGSLCLEAVGVLCVPFLLVGTLVSVLYTVRCGNRNLIKCVGFFQEILQGVDPLRTFHRGGVGDLRGPDLKRDPIFGQLRTFFGPF